MGTNTKWNSQKAPDQTISKVPNPGYMLPNLNRSTSVQRILTSRS